MPEAETQIIQVDVAQRLHEFVTLSDIVKGALVVKQVRIDIQSNQLEFKADIDQGSLKGGTLIDALSREGVGACMYEISITRDKGRREEIELLVQTFLRNVVSSDLSSEEYERELVTISKLVMSAVYSKIGGNLALKEVEDLSCCLVFVPFSENHKRRMGKVGVTRRQRPMWLKKGYQLKGMLYVAYYTPQDLK
jgi:hypothetical protein